MQKKKKKKEEKELGENLSSLSSVIKINIMCTELTHDRQSTSQRMFQQCKQSFVVPTAWKHCDPYCSKVIRPQ